MIFTHGGNSIRRGSLIDPDIVILQDWMTTGVGIQPSSGNIPNAEFDANGPLDVSGTGWSGTPYVRNNRISNPLATEDILNYSIQYDFSQDYISSVGYEFTLEAWFRLVTASGLYSTTDTHLVGMKGSNTDFLLGCFNNNEIFVYNNGRKNPGFTMVVSEWHHIAIVCHNNATKGYIDGDSVSGSSLIQFTSDKFIICPRVYQEVWGSRYNSPQYDYAQICLTKRAKWTSNFTPPTRPYCLGIQ